MDLLLAQREPSNEPDIELVFESEGLRVGRVRRGWHPDSLAQRSDAHGRDTAERAVGRGAGGEVAERMRGSMPEVEDLAQLADWSGWTPFVAAVGIAPREPGVYLARQGNEVLYVAMAGLRDRGGKAAPKGLRGRLAFYGSGKALASGLGEAVFARAIADPEWLRVRG